MKRQIKAETMISVLAAIALFCVIYLSYSQWLSQQNLQTAKQYQEQQAWQIVENEIALSLAEESLCGQTITQNSLQFKVACTHSQITVTFPLGEIVLDKP